MTDDKATRLALGVTVAMGVALAAALVLTGGRENAQQPVGPITGPGPKASPGRSVSFEDSRALSRTQPWIKEWNAASKAWTRALGAGRERFEREYSAPTRKMDVNSLRIRLSASRIGNPRLRTLFRRLGDAYRGQFKVVLETNQAVLADDREAAQVALERLEEAEQRRVRAATALIDAFPDLAGDPGRLK